MTLQSCKEIIYHTTLLMHHYGFFPDAICVSRAIHDSLYDEIMLSPVLKFYADNDGHVGKTTLYGFVLYVNDVMPDEYYCIGTVEMFDNDPQAKLIT